ncbi:response regulator [Ornithinimicrobium faecis]|uniref:Response regulator n=1 Tax=Ornithinimicrobium faecis TaxID=2934158 RepID=A0ABY4YSK5_9MICO|nr:MULTISPECIES: response regulator [unclassified Ornithinimicrobium]USQ79747.1 response regulator [Ornithinimicrobium sp. HY1793]
MTQGTVLVADDDDDIRDLVAFKLESAGYAVEATSDGDQAWTRVQEVRPDLAILDVMMPGLSGLDVLRRIRADEALASTRVILLTARAREVDVDAGFSTGADDYVVKPFSPRELIHRVAALLGGGPRR